jgi:Flp pilus assembly protein TadD
MARGTQHRKRRPAANARVAQPAPKAKNRVKHQSWEDQLFFSRLRVHAKWVFVFLALVFGLGFVLFGVGSGSSGIGDVMQNLFTRGGGGSSSLSSLQKKAKENPKSPKAWRDLATKLETDQKTERATVALQHYLRLRPKDEAAVGELANLYTQRAGDYYNLYRQVQGEQELYSPTSIFRPATTTAIGKAFPAQDPITTLQNKQLTDRLNAALQKLGILNSQSEGAYKRLAKLAPQNASYQLQLGEVAANLGDKQTAITAYKTFLKLAPNDSLAPRARQRLKQVEALKNTPAPATTKTSGR